MFKMKGSSFYGKTLKCHSDSPLKQGDLAVSTASRDFKKAETTSYKNALDEEQKAAEESEKAKSEAIDSVASSAAEALTHLDSKK
tara:strand:- start:3427 stop:3681 length:255 start_codon:yes stop_codon:yes gene_type:complete